MQQRKSTHVLCIDIGPMLYEGANKRKILGGLVVLPEETKSTVFCKFSWNLFGLPLLLVG
jgi:hypothetical protein